MVRFANKFVLEREIGSGGMSTVFLGRDEVLDRPVAIKILKPGFGETDIGARFRREGRTAARLSHPNIVQVYDAGEDELDGREVSYIVMEYVPGGDLKDLIDRRGTFSGGNLATLSGVAAGLAHAHERGVIHRDIKPHNILLDENGRPKLADFGIARALGTTYATRTGSYLGTALYSSPEQLRGEGVTPKSDIYSLGATLYHATTGQPPFAGAPIEVASQHVSSEPTPPRQLNDAVSASLEPLILDCLKKDPGSRPTADEVRRELLEAGRGVHAIRAYAAPPAPGPTKKERAPTAATQPGGAQSLPGRTVYGKRRGRREALVVLALVALLALAGIIVAPTLLGGGDQGANAPEQNGENPSGGQVQGGQNPQQEPPAQQSAAQPDSPQPSPQQAGEGQGQTQAIDGLTEAEAAAQMVKNHYEVAASDNYEDTWNSLSSRYQQEIGSPEAWTSQFRTLESIEFTEGPATTEVSGGTATVSFSTIAHHSHGNDPRTGTAILVRENGEWKIDSINVS
jgi:eukaryotic-like serine/threonine-protein kinase